MTTMYPIDNTTEGRVLVTCPDCGQIEWWTPEEVQDHGYCRTLRPYPVEECPACGGKGGNVMKSYIKRMPDYYISGIEIEIFFREEGPGIPAACWGYRLRNPQIPPEYQEGGVIGFASAQEAEKFAREDYKSYVREYKDRYFLSLGW